MSLSSVYLPDGRSYTVQPVFGGFFFKNNELNIHPVPFPAGWTVALHTEEAVGHDPQPLTAGDDNHHLHQAQYHQRPYRSPTLQNDAIFISSISHSSASEYKPNVSSSRQIALMLWVSLYWYFQQAEPAPYLHTQQAMAAPAVAKPKGDWRIRIARDGVFRSGSIIPKLERMGLIASFDTSAGSGADGGEREWDQMFVTRRAFWQIHSGIFLFTLQPLKPHVSHPGSPVSSRPLSPAPPEPQHGSNSPATLSISPYPSSLMPTYCPPPPLQYIVTNNIRHPRRQKPPRMGEIFYSRFIPSVGKYLSFRVASLSPKQVPHLGLRGSEESQTDLSDLSTLSDCSLLQRWLSKPRVSAFWGEYHENFLPNAMKAQHSFPVIGLWDGVPWGYFEIYWVKEDPLGQQMGNDAQDFDRGMHVIVGEEWARGKVAVWLSSLIHWCWQADNRTMNIYLEPRVDNARLIQHLQTAGFSKDKQITFPHKQSWLCRLRREVWEGPAL